MLSGLPLPLSARRSPASVGTAPHRHLKRPPFVSGGQRACRGGGPKQWRASLPLQESNLGAPCAPLGGTPPALAVTHPLTLCWLPSTPAPGDRPGLVSGFALGEREIVWQLPVNGGGCCCLCLVTNAAGRAQRSAEPQSVLEGMAVLGKRRCRRPFRSTESMQTSGDAPGPPGCRPGLGPRAPRRPAGMA